MMLCQVPHSMPDPGAEQYLRLFADLPVVSLGLAPGSDCEILAVLGGSHPDASFKNLLAIGMLTLAREKGLLKPGQRVGESSSGSMGEGLALAGLILGHPVTIVTDKNLSALTTMKINMLGAELVTVEQPHPTLGWQQAREDALRDLLEADREMFATDQNNSPLNPETHRRWLVPALERQIDPRTISAGVFGVGSGGHFAGLTRWLKAANPQVKAHAADRIGSITFGGTPGPSPMRGVGNQNTVPAVIRNAMSLVDGVECVETGEAFRACHEVAARYGLFVGGSSGLAYVAAIRVAQRLGRGKVLTLFPDRGEIYAGSIFDREWMVSNGYLH